MCNDSSVFCPQYRLWILKIIVLLPDGKGCRGWGGSGGGVPTMDARISHPPLWWIHLSNNLDETHSRSKQIWNYFSFILMLYLQHMEVSSLGVRWELQLPPTPQQHQIRATSANYATACGNARSLTHWVKPGIKSVSSWTLYWILNSLSHNGQQDFKG